MHSRSACLTHIHLTTQRRKAASDMSSFMVTDGLKTIMNEWHAYANFCRAEQRKATAVSEAEMRLSQQSRGLLKELETKHDDHVNSMQKRHMAEVEELRTRLESELARRVSELNDELEHTRTTHRKELDQQAEHSAAELRGIRQEKEEERLRLEADISKLKVEHERQVRDMEVRHAAERAAADKAATDKYDKEVARGANQLAATIANYQQELQQAAQRFDDEVRKNVEDVQKLAREHEQAMKEAAEDKAAADASAKVPVPSMHAYM